MNKPSFRERVLRVREDAIVASVNRLLAEKGFESMTVDEVAADVGIAKASLYKHFASKEELAAAAMVSVLDRALAFLEQEAGARSDADRSSQGGGALDDAGATGRRDALAALAELHAAQRADAAPRLPRPRDDGQRAAGRLDHSGAGRRAGRAEAAARGGAVHALRTACDPVLPSCAQAAN